MKDVIATAIAVWFLGMALLLILIGPVWDAIAKLLG